MIFAYPPGRAKMAQNDGGQAAMQRRKTKLGDNMEFNANDYEKILGENQNDKSFKTDSSDDEKEKPKPIDAGKKERRASLK